MKQTIINFVVGLLTVIVAILALIMTLGVLAVFGTQVSSWPLLGFMALIIYSLIPKISGTLLLSVVLIAACTYFGIMLLSRFFYQPLYYLMMITLAVSGVAVMLKGKPWWMWLIIAFVFISFGIFLLYNNGIIGPMEFMISDRPFDYPAQWYHCYRFFWTGVLLNLIAWSASIISIIILFAYSMLIRYKSSLKGLLDYEL
jgi:hypothetical protein